MDDIIPKIRLRYPILRLLAGSVCISFSPIFIKLSALSPDVAGFYRMLFAGVSLLPIILWTGGMTRIPRKSFFLLSAAGLVLALDFMCWHRSINLVGPGLSTLLGNFQVFFTAVFSYLFLKEKITGMFFLAVLMALCGLLLVTGVDWTGLPPGSREGIVLGLGTAILYSTYIMMLKESMRHLSVSGMSAILMVSISSTLLLGIVTLATGASFAIPSAGSLFSLIGVGVMGTTLGWSLISSAIRHVPATIAGLVLLMQPTLAFVWDVVFFDRPTGIDEVFGIMLILMAIYMGSYKK